MNVSEVCGLQKLRCDLRAIEGRVGRVVDRSSPSVKRTNLASSMPWLSAGPAGHKTRSDSALQLIKLDRVVGRGHPAGPCRPAPPSRRGSAVCCASSASAMISSADGEAGRQEIPEKARVLVFWGQGRRACPGKVHDRRERARGRPVSRNGPGGSRRIPAAADRAGPELDARHVTFAYCAQAHDEPDFSGLGSPPGQDARPSTD